MAFGPYTKEQLDALWRTFFPRSYTVPIEEEGDGQGFDIYSQQSAQFARVSEAENVTAQAYYLRPHSTQTGEHAMGARRATGFVEMRRAAPATGDVTLIAGTELVADVITPQGDVLDGVRYRVTADTTIAAGNLGPVTVPIEAVRVGYQGNVPRETIKRFVLRGRATIPAATVEGGNVLRDSGPALDRLTPAMVGQYVRLIGGTNGGTTPRRILSVTQGTPTSSAVLDGPPLVDPDLLTQAEVEEFGDLGLTIEQPVATSGGRHGFLDAIARDRGTGRQPGESDEQLRERLTFLDDIISPAAILRIAARILTPLGIGFELHETRDPNCPGFVLDYSPLDWGTVCDCGYSSVFWPETRFFVLCVGRGNQGEFGFPYDATAPGLSNALDAEGVDGVSNFLDGYPTLYYAALAALYEAIDRARAAGVAWAIAFSPDL